MDNNEYITNILESVDNAVNSIHSTLLNIETLLECLLNEGKPFDNESDVV